MATTPHILHVCLDISSTPILTGHARGLADKSSIARQTHGSLSLCAPANGRAISSYKRNGVWDPNITPLHIPC